MPQHTPNLGETVKEWRVIQTIKDDIDLLCTPIGVYSKITNSVSCLPNLIKLDFGNKKHFFSNWSISEA